MYSYFKRIAGFEDGNYICFWKSKRLSDENITPHAVAHYLLPLSKIRLFWY